MALLALAERVSRRLLSLQGVESRTMRTTVGRVHWYDAPGAGTLPTVVLLHGLGASATQYGQLIRMLRPHVRRVIAPDAPGHGFTPSGEEITPETLFAGLLELLESTLSERAIIFGNSMGGALAIQIGLQRPELTRGLFLVSPGGAAMSDADFASFMRTFEIRSRQQAADFVPRLYYQKPWFTHLVAHDIVELFSKPSIRALIEALGPEHLFKAEELQSLTMPIRLVWGQADTLMPKENLEFFRKNLPAHAVIEEPEEFGHSPYLDRSAAVAELLISFATSLERAGESDGK
jgi:pimeloyl-ACP methyl ester carboxylesterase